ncbi:glycosyltransferase [Sphingomonas adhaesiva]|uniref:glycosyltransferase n=1 Tax=Sphingomonas adhaesiva TaxID=28212 RepID=UPI002FFCC3B0
MARTGAAPRNVVFISRQRLVGATNGSSAYLLDLAKAVRDAGFVPHLVQPSPTVAGRWPVLSLRPEMDVFASHRIRGLVRIGRRFVTPAPHVYAAIARSLVASAGRRLGFSGAWTEDRKLPYAVAIPWTAADHRWLAQAARGKADIAIADYMFCAEGIASLPDPAVPSAIVMHDLFHARKGGGADSVALVTREQEVTMLSRADAVVAIQPAEAAFVAEHVPATRAIVAPMAATPVAAPQPGEHDRLLFVGSNTAPNVVGLQWFFDAVWPAIRAACPQATLDVAGTVGRAFDSAPEGVRLLGLVDDLDPLYTRAGVVISPLTFGSGLKIKLIEALARGKAIVATTITVEGAERETEDAVHVTDDAARFADHVVALNRDPAARAALAQAALTAARDHYSAQSCYAAFVEWLRSAAR